MAWIEKIKNTKEPAWRVGRRVGGTKQYSEIFYTYRLAEDKKAAWRLERPGRLGIPGTQLEGLWQKYLQHCVEEGLAASTIKWKALEMGHMFKRFKILGDLTTDNIAAYRTELTNTICVKGRNKGKPYSINTVKDKLRMLRTFVSWLVDRDYLQRDPMRLISIGAPERTGRAYSKEVIDQFIEASKRIKRFHKAFMVLVTTGARLGECLDKMEWGNISRDGQCILEKTKNKTNRAIYLRPEVLKLLGPRGTGKVFEGYTRDIFYDDWIKVRSSVGLEHVVPHHFRHSYATHYAKRFKDPAALQQVMGWKDINTANTYVHLMENWVAQTQKDFEYVD